MKKCRFLVLFIVAFFTVLSGCSPTPLPKKTVATVNNEPISFTQLEAKRLALHPLAAESITATTADVLQKQYAYSLRQLIFEKLILQFMQSKGQTLDLTALAEKEAIIRNDYPGDTFEQILLTEGISLEEWHHGLTVQTLIDQFIARYIRPEVSITPQEVETFYAANKQHLFVSEQWHFLQITGEKKEWVSEAIAIFNKSDDVTQIQKDYLVSIRDVQMGIDHLPEDVIATIAPLQIKKSSAVEKSGDTFRAFILLEKIPERPLNGSEISEIIEKNLGEEKIQQVYRAWLEKRIKKSNIAIHPSLSVTLTP